MSRVCAIAGGGSQVARDLIARLEGAAWELSAVDVDDYDLHDLGEAGRWAGSLGRVDALVHLVGGWRGGKPLSEASLEDWSLLHGLLVRTVQHTTRAFAPALKQAGERGRFVLVSSKQAQAPTSTNAAYATAKAAAEAWTLAFADELAETRGTANILVVNAIVTPRMREQNPDKEYRTFTDARHMADAIAWIVSDAAAAMNGQRLSLHG